MATITDAKIKMPTIGERGVGLTGPFYTLDRIILDYHSPSIAELEAMLDVDGQARALEQAVIDPMLGTPFRILAGDGDKGEKKFVEEVLFTPQFQGGMTTPIMQVLRQMASAFARKRAFFQKVWKRRADGKLVYHKIAWRPPSTCFVRFDKNGSFGGFQQKTMGINGEQIEENFDPPDAFVFIHEDWVKPLEGQSMFTAAYRDFIDKQKVRLLYFFHLQNVALRSMKVTQTSNDPQARAKLKAEAAKLRGGGVIVLNEGEDIDEFQSVRTAEDFADALTYLNAQMSISVLAHFINLGGRGDRGSWALSRDQSDFFLMSLESKLKEMASALTAYVVAPLVYYNFGPDAVYPEWYFEPLSEHQKEAALQFYEAIVVGQGIRNLRPGVADAIEKRALPRMGIPEEEIAKLQSQPEPPPTVVEAQNTQDGSIQAALNELQRLMGEGNTDGTGNPNGTANPDRGQPGSGPINPNPAPAAAPSR